MGKKGGALEGELEPWDGETISMGGLREEEEVQWFDRYRLDGSGDMTGCIGVFIGVAKGKMSPSWI